MEKLFKARWWDYHNRKFNINGRICLETLIPFGFIGTILLKFVNPFILENIGKLSPEVRKYVLMVLIIIITIDTIISLFVIGSLRKTATEVEKRVAKDDTEEISNKVKEITTKKAEELVDNTKEIVGTTKKNLIRLPNSINMNAKKFEDKVHYSGVKIKNGLKERVKSAKEFTETVKEKYDKNWFNRRFLKAFPNLQISTKLFGTKDEKNK